MLRSIQGPETPVKTPRYFIPDSPIKSNPTLQTMIATKTGPEILNAFNAAETKEQAAGVAYALHHYIDDIVVTLEVPTTVDTDTVPEMQMSDVMIEDDGDEHGLDLSAVLSDKVNKTDADKKISEIKKDLKGFHVDLTETLTVEVVDGWRDKFLRTLADKVIMIQQNNKQTRVVMSAGEVSQVTNFFYDKVFGGSGQLQAVGVITAYNKVDTGSDEALVQRARNLASNSQQPESFRVLIRDFGDCINFQAKQSIAIRAFNANRSLFNFMHQYDYMVKQARAGNKTIAKEFQRVGIRKGKGRSYTGQVQEYLRIVLQLDPKSSRVDNVLQQGTMVQQMVKTFGRGVLVLLPHCVGRELQLIGSAKLSMALKLFMDTANIEMLTDIDAVCTWLREHVYTPLINGEEMLVGKIGRKGPFYDRLCAAEVQREDEEDDGTDDSLAGEDVDMVNG